MKSVSQPLGIRSAGMVTGVGLSAPASCAAIRCAIDSFTETRFVDEINEWIVGSAVPLEKPWRGLPKLVRMAASAIRECLAGAPEFSCESIPLILCVAEPARPGRTDGLDDWLFDDLQYELGVRFHSLSDVIAAGRIGGARALTYARQLIAEEKVPGCIIVGVDSFLSGDTLLAYRAKRRLLSSDNSNGFLPGEAAAAIFVAPAAVGDFVCLGIGEGLEKATIESEEPLRGDGMTQAFAAALADAGCDWTAIDYRLADCNGEEYGFREANLALNRLLRIPKPAFEIWHPADCIGEVGAATVPCLLGIALQAYRKGYAPGRGALAHCGNDRGERFAMVLRGSERGMR